jgi:acyl-CoA thioesterase FadM
MTPRTFEYAFTVRLHDIDGAGIVFFARIQQLAHDAYEALLTPGHSIAGLHREGRYIIPIGSVEADPAAAAPGRGHPPASLMEMTGSSYRVRIRLVGPKSDGPREDLRAEIRLRCVAVLRSTMRPTAVPPDLRQALATFLESPPA